MAAPLIPCLPPTGRPGLGPVFHACTSTTYKRTLGMFYSACCAYLNARPPTAVGWVVPKAYHIDALVGDAAFRARCVALSVKLSSMGAALRFAGQKLAAKKARMQAPCAGMRVLYMRRAYLPVCVFSPAPHHPGGQTDSLLTMFHVTRAAACPSA